MSVEKIPLMFYGLVLAYFMTGCPPPVEELPEITQVDGDGIQAGIVSNQDLPINPEDRKDATHRIRTALIISGKNLDKVEKCELRGKDGANRVFTEKDGLMFEQGGTALEKKLLLPKTIFAGAFTLALLTSFGEATAQVYVLQGEKGEKGDSAEPSPSDQELLAKISNVDGADSGLDADTLDGLEAVTFASAADTSDMEAELTARLDSIEASLDTLQSMTSDLKVSLPTTGNIWQNTRFLRTSSADPALPEGWSFYSSGGSSVTIEAVTESPFYKGFIGPYSETKPPGSSSSPEAASATSPYWYGVWNCGPRISRWGWGGMSFNLLHLTISGDATYTLVYQDHSDLLVGNHAGRYHFRAYVKILRGEAFGVSQGAGASSLIVTKQECDAAPEGWCLLDGSFHGSNTAAVMIGFGRPGGVVTDLEVLVALPYLYVENPLWRDK